jgi:Na+-driven multidrug efflux pump
MELDETSLGSDPETSAMAGHYSSVLSCTVPANTMFRQVSQVFVAQRIVQPERNASILGLALNLILGLLFVLGWQLPGFEG